jgi:hypothetical protein
MWFSSKDKKIAEAVNYVIADCDETLRELNYRAADEVRQSVARTVLEKTYIMNMTLLYGAIDGRALLEVALKKVTFERQQAAGCVKNQSYPRVDAIWASAALFEGYLQVLLLSNKQEQKVRMTTLLNTWIEVVLGRQEIDKITSRIKSQISS